MDLNKIIAEKWRNVNFHQILSIAPEHKSLHQFSNRSTHTVYNRLRNQQ